MNCLLSPKVLNQSGPTGSGSVIAVSSAQVNCAEWETFNVTMPIIGYSSNLCTIDGTNVIMKVSGTFNCNFVWVGGKPGPTAGGFRMIIVKNGSNVLIHDTWYYGNGAGGTGTTAVSFQSGDVFNFAYAGKGGDYDISTTNGSATMSLVIQ